MAVCSPGQFDDKRTRTLHGGEHQQSADVRGLGPRSVRGTAQGIPERAQLHELLARSLALGGHKAEAIAEAERSLAMRETTLDASIGPYVRLQVARVLVQSGEYEKALDLLEPLLTVYSSDMTPAWLRLDPTFKPLYGNARFQRLIK